MIVKHFQWLSKTSPWSLWTIISDLISQSKPSDLIKWLIFTAMSMTITTYLNVYFFSMITVNVSQALPYLMLMMIFENVTAYCTLKQLSAKKMFLLDFVKRCRTKLHRRILSADWMKIKLSDQAEIRRKIDDAIDSIQNLMDELIDHVKEMFKIVVTITTIIYIYPSATVLIGLVYSFFYQFYLKQKSNQLLQRKLEVIEKHDRLSEKYTRITSNTFDYIIHHEKDKIIDITNRIKIDIERHWFDLDYLYNHLSFQEDILGKTTIFIMIVTYWFLNGSYTLIIPLFHYLTSLSESIQLMIVSYIRWLRLIKDYEVIQPTLEDYERRINFEQIDLQSMVEVENIIFHYRGKREGFVLQLNGSLRFQMGETILVKGKSGAGKSTFYDILNGSICASEYEGKIRIDSRTETRTFHSIENCRTVVLQDADMDYRSTIYSMIADLDEEQLKEKKGKVEEFDFQIWKFLQLVKIDDFVRDELKSNFDEPLENRLSGGQKTRLLLARSLYRADQRHSSMLILDEPDKGLPAETTVTIIKNIMNWFQTKGILFLTLHTEQAHQLQFDQILNIENGFINKIK